MNDEKEKFRASLKVIQGGNGKNTSIDIPLEDNKEKDELEKEKKRTRRTETRISRTSKNF